MVVLFAIACGLVVANLYYAQPLLPAIAESLKLSSVESSLIVAIGQIGYVVGIALLVPLGDAVNRRRLAIVLLLVAALASGIAAGASSLLVLLVATLAVSAGTVVILVLLPLAASLAAPERRGRVVGTIMSGILIGVLLARTTSGFIAQIGSWRAVYIFSALVMLTLAVILGRVLPYTPPADKLRYWALLRSLGSIVREEPLLRRRALYGFLSFAGFNVLWTSLAFLLTSKYGYSQVTIGLFGLAGLAGVLIAERAGKLIDVGRERLATLGFLLVICVGWLCMLYQSGHDLVMLIVGIVLLDLGVQGAHVLNQGVIYRLRPEARGRITTVYMTVYFLGGAAGSFLSGQAYTRGSWLGVGIIGLIFACAALAAYFCERFNPSM